MKTIGKVTIEIIVTIICLIGWSILCQKLWLWFLIPTFPELPVLTLKQSLGIIMFMQIIHQTNIPKRQIEYTVEEEVTHSVIRVIIPYLLLLIDYIIYILIN